MSKIKQFKQELKILAAQLKDSKIQFKDCQRKDDYYFVKYKEWAEANKLSKYFNFPVHLADNYRHKHIAYCLLRGRTYEQIENKVREGNEPDFTKIEKIMQEYREVEAVSCRDTVVDNV